MRAHPFKHHPILLNTTLSFRMRACNHIVLNRSPSFRKQPRPFEHNPVLSNASPRFQTQPRPFEHNPFLSNASLSFQTPPHPFEHHLVLLNTTPSFRMRGCNHIVSNRSPSFRT